MVKPMRSSGTSVLHASALYFALVFAAGFLLGSIRIPLLVPRLGVRVAELLELPVMLIVIFFASRHVVRRFALDAGVSVAVGVLALVLLLAAELVLTVAIFGRSIAAYISTRDPVSGSAYLGSLLLYAAMPWMHARKRGAHQ